MSEEVKKTTRKPTGAAAMGPGPGRPPGVPNKLTLTIKQAVEQAFQQVGGADYLAKLAEVEPRAFVALVSKLIPNNVTVEGGLDVRHLFTPDQLRRMADLQEGKE